MGRHWPTPRYADSNGLMALAYAHAWRYRDYAMDCFNADAFDRFVIEQIAGDLWPKEVLKEANRLKIATGFLALGPKLWPSPIR